MRHASFRCTSFKNRQETSGPAAGIQIPVLLFVPPRHGMGDGVRSVSARYIDLSGVNTWHGT